MSLHSPFGRLMFLRAGLKLLLSVFAASALEAKGANCDMLLPPNDEPVHQISVERAAMLKQVFERLQNHAGVRAALFVCDIPEINATALNIKRKVPAVLLTTSLVTHIIKDDEDIAAIVVGHEVGHHALGHLT